MNTALNWARLLTAALVLVAWSGCSKRRSDSGVERAAEKTKRAVERTGEKVEGAAERAGERIEGAAERAKDKVD